MVLPVSYLVLNLGCRCGSSLVWHLPLAIEVPGSIPARGEENFGVRTRFLLYHLKPLDDTR